MKIQGSKRAFVICRECDKESPPFRVYLCTVEGDPTWEGDIPVGWVVAEEEALNDDGSIWGYCPTHGLGL